MVGATPLVSIPDILLAGARGLLRAAATPEELCNALRTVVAGRSGSAARPWIANRAELSTWAARRGLADECPEPDDPTLYVSAANCPEPYPRRNLPRVQPASEAPRIRKPCNLCGT